MKIRKNYIKSLVLFLLLVFLIPSILKTAHHHNPKCHHFFNSSTEQKISILEKPCLICQFEFVHFITPQADKKNDFQFAKPSSNPEIIFAEYKTTFDCFSHRAPPFSC